MYLAQTANQGNICVSNCQSVSLYSDPSSNVCVGCHAACETCFGPQNDECFECSDGFVQVSDNTCDTQCFPENSYLVGGEKCMRKSFVTVTGCSVSEAVPQLLRKRREPVHGLLPALLDQRDFSDVCL